MPFAVALAQAAPPTAPVRDQVDTWHGVAVHDPYRYMMVGRPVLLRVDAQDGHGVGRTPAQGRSIGADTYSFLLWQMNKRRLQDAR